MLRLGMTRKAPPFGMSTFNRLTISSTIVPLTRGLLFFYLKREFTIGWRMIEIEGSFGCHGEGESVDFPISGHIDDDTEHLYCPPKYSIFMCSMVNLH